jgi:arabinogalactan oligomer/maltooligosaccharide transport system permease protein
MSSITVYVFGFIQALIIESKNVIWKSFWRAILILPWAIPSLISLMLFRNVFADNGGLMNQILVQFDLMEPVKVWLTDIGLVGQNDPGSILWLTSPQNGALAKVIVLVVNLWLGFPYFMMLITGVLGTIPKDLYEAAEIDGANGFQKFRYVTLPMVLRATAPIIVTTFTFNFNNFGAIYFLTGGGPGYPLSEIPQSVLILGAAPGQTDILISWIYKLSFGSSNNQFNLAAVYSILIFVFIGLTSIYNLSKIKSFWEEE